MDWLKQLIKKYPFFALILPTGLSVFSFLGSLLIALMDTSVGISEFHKFILFTEFLQTLLLVFIMVFLNQE